MPVAGLSVIKTKQAIDKQTNQAIIKQAIQATIKQATRKLSGQIRRLLDGDYQTALITCSARVALSAMDNLRQVGLKLCDRTNREPSAPGVGIQLDGVLQDKFA